MPVITIAGNDGISVEKRREMVKEVSEVVRKEAMAYGDEIDKEFRGTDRYHIFVKEENKR